MSNTLVSSVPPNDHVESAEFMKKLPCDSKEKEHEKPSSTMQKTQSTEPSRSSDTDQYLSQKQNKSGSGTHGTLQGQDPIGLPSREIIHQSAQQLVEDINHKRKQDTEFIQDFKKALEMNIERTMGCVEQNLYQLYNQQSQKIQILLQTLFETLDRVASIETELQHFRQVLGNLYQDIQHND